MNDTIKRITGCEVCDAPSVEQVIDLGDQPMADDLVPIGSDAKPQTYPLRLAACPRCLTVHQEVQVEKRLLFPRTYHYRAAMTQDVLDGMHELVEATEAIVGDLAGKQVLDIGCNDGSLLGFFREKGARTTGIEPTGAADDAETRVDLVLNRFFDEGAVEEYLGRCPRPDVITFTNVFAHIEDLNGMLANLRRLMKAETKLIIENHYLGAVLDRFQFDTFYHEHPRTYSARSFGYIAEKLGRNVERIEFPPRYNGNIRVVIGDGAVSGAGEVDESSYLEALRHMGRRIPQVREQTRVRLQGLVAEQGPLPAKSFPARAAIVVHAFGLDETLINATYERPMSPKVGNYVPGTRIEIRSEEEFLAHRIASPVLVNFAWHIQGEIERYMRTRGYRGEIMPILG